MTANGSGKLNVTFLPNQLIGPADGTVTGYNSWVVPGGFSLRPVCLWDLKAAVNFFAARTFVEMRGPRLHHLQPHFVDESGPMGS